MELGVHFTGSAPTHKEEADMDLHRNLTDQSYASRIPDLQFAHDDTRVTL
jgi:hypothetical protein